MARFTREQQRMRDMDRWYNYRESFLTYHMRFLGMFVISILALPTAGALVYAGIQVWAWSITGRIYPTYFYPCLAIIGLFLFVSTIISKCNRPMDEY
jgi:hypothetical protein